MRKLLFALAMIVAGGGVLCPSAVLRAQQTGSGDATHKSAEQATPAPPKTSPSYSGTYTFLKEGEFLQLTVEDGGRVTGFISRFGEGESDKGEFLDQFFKSGKLEGNKLTFVTQIVHGVSFEFKGSVERGEGKAPGDEAYYVLKGTLAENTTDANKKTTSHSQEALFRIFPRDAAPAAVDRK